jgi:transposase
VKKESGMLDRFLKRMENGLEVMSKSAEKGRLKDISTANQRLGRLREKNWRASACFEVKIEEVDGKLSITWMRDEKKKRDLCGTYLLRTNVAVADPIELWKQYIQLVDAEWALRITKDELELRPIWHHDKERVQGHILVCFIAYAMWKTLGGWMKGAGLGDSPRELLEELAAVKSGDVLLPTCNPDGSAGVTLMIRCVTRPDEHTGVLLNRLGIELPNHLKRQRLELESPATATACTK